MRAWLVGKLRLEEVVGRTNSLRELLIPRSTFARGRGGSGFSDPTPTPCASRVRPGQTPQLSLQSSILCLAHDLFSPCISVSR